MTVTHKALAAAKIAFQTAPQPATAAQYMTLLIKADNAGLLHPDTLYNGLAAIEEYLVGGGTICLGEGDNAITIGRG